MPKPFMLHSTSVCPWNMVLTRASGGAGACKCTLLEAITLDLTDQSLIRNNMKLHALHLESSTRNLINTLQHSISCHHPFNCLL